jgi:hypothetical protein
MKVQGKENRKKRGKSEYNHIKEILRASRMTHESG